MNSYLNRIVVCATFAAIASVSQAQLFSAILDGPSESPPNSSPGTGFADITINTALSTMRVQASFSGLVAGVTASHIHATTASPFTGTAGVATQTPTFSGFPSGVTSGTYDNTFDMTQAASYNASFISGNGGTPASAFSALVSAMQQGRAYFNIHTTAFAGGEIRGFLSPVPEPGTLLALGGLLCVTAVGRLRRRNRKE